MKLNHIIIIVSLTLFFLASCKFSKPPGIQFEMMKGTPVWSLAKAVEQEDTSEIGELIQEKHLDVNYKERNSEFGKTLLHLAVDNCLLLSVKALLENGAKQNIRDSAGNFPINDILLPSYPLQYRMKMLELLLRYGADPNSQVKGYRNGDTMPFQVGVPLIYAVYNLDCTKLLLKYGADVYCNIKPRNFEDSCIKYPIWYSLFISQIGENTLVAKYLIVDKNMPIPNPLYYVRSSSSTEYEIRSVTTLEILNKTTLTNPTEQKAKVEIMNYLKKEGFPEHGSIPNPPPKRR